MTRLLLRHVVLRLAALFLLFVAPAQLHAAPVVTSTPPLVVGVKTNYAPFAARDAAGRFAGFEIELARLLGRALERPVRFVGVSSANRFEKLAQGEVDLLLATVGDTTARRAAGDKVLIQPHYYASGTRLLVRREHAVDTWSAFDGLRLCGLMGNYSNLGLRRLGARLVLYADIRALENALVNRVCDGWAYDDVRLAAMVKQERFAAFDLRLPPREATAWSAVLPAAARDGALHTAIRNAFARWHRDGTLVRLAAARGLDTAFLRDRQTVFNGACGDDATMAACRLPAAATLREPAATAPLARWFADHGIDLPMLSDRTAQQVFIDGALTTVQLALATFAFGFLAGGGAAWALCTMPRLARPVRVLIDTSRMTPPVLQLLMLFYVVVAATPGGGTDWSFWIAVFILGLHGAAISAASVHEAFLALPDDMEDVERFAAAYETALEMVASATLGMAKASPMAAIILTPELVSASRDITLSDRGYPWETYVVLLLFVIALVGFLYGMFALLKRHAQRWLARIAAQGSVHGQAQEARA